MSNAHPAADIFPWMSEDSLQELANDIAEHGQQIQIARLADGRIVDGRNRELACVVAGVKPSYRTVDKDEDEVIDFIVSTNLKRRDLTPSQRAMAAAELATLKRGRPQEKQGDEQENPSREGFSQAQAASQLGASVASTERAAKVKNEAPELVESVKAGKLDVKTAAKAAKLPKSKRKKIAESDDPKKAAKEALAKEESKEEEAATEEPQAVDEGEEFVGEVETLCRDMDQIAARAKALKKSRYSYSIHIDSAVSQIEAARKTLWQGRPAHACPYCEASKSNGCKACNGTKRVKQSTMKIGKEAMGGVQ